MYRQLAGLALASFVAVAGGSASATTVVFDGEATDSYSDFTVTASAAGILNFCGATVTNSSGSNGGLGVNGCPDTQPTQIDGFPLGSSERLTFNFNSTVLLTGVTLTRLDRDDEYNVFVNGSYVGTGNDESWSGGIELDSFAIEASGHLLEGDGIFFLIGPYDDFRVRSISYEVIEAAPVPLPAAGLLLLGGLGGLVAMRKRKAA